MVEVPVTEGNLMGNSISEYLTREFEFLFDSLRSFNTIVLNDIDDSTFNNFVFSSSLNRILNIMNNYCCIISVYCYFLLSYRFFIWVISFNCFRNNFIPLIITPLSPSYITSYQVLTSMANESNSLDYRIWSLDLTIINHIVNSSSYGFAFF